MKNLTQWILGLVAAVALMAAPCNAQQLFSSQRSIVLAAPQIITAATTATAFAVTNGPIDIGGFVGEAFIDINSFTNAGGVMTATIDTSNNSTNATSWTALSSFAVIPSTTSYSYTNYTDPGFASNVYATNPYLLPGTITTPTAYSAGFQTPYLAPLQWTNTTPVTITTKGVYRLGIRAVDQKRYLRIIFTPTGASTNWVGSATFNGVRSAEVQ